MESTRLPRKMLLDRTGTPLVQHTWLAASRSRLADQVMVATDHPDIARIVEGFGGQVILTSPDHASGTDRLAEVARQHPDFDIWVNVQGDEPEMDPQHIDAAIAALRNAPAADMATLACPIRQPDLLTSPACVKVVFDAAGRALYFSRSPIPFARSGFATALDDYPDTWFQHIGIYVYRRPVLLELTESDRPSAERAESLEQLRALHLGKTILVRVVPAASPGIDTPEDYEAFVSRFSS